MLQISSKVAKAQKVTNLKKLPIQIFSRESKLKIAQLAMSLAISQRWSQEWTRYKNQADLFIFTIHYYIITSVVHGRCTFEQSRVVLIRNGMEKKF